jgi:hypothetical protein
MTDTITLNNKNIINTIDWYQYYDDLVLLESDNTEERTKWVELMGNDLMMKSVSYGTSSIDNNNGMKHTYRNDNKKNPNDENNNVDDNNTDTDTIAQCTTKYPQEEVQERQAVQVQDAVIVDIIGRYIPNTTTTSTSTTTTKSYDIDTINIETAIKEWPIFHIEKDLLVIIGDKEVIPCLEMCIRFMYKNQTSLLYSHSKYAYGTGIRQSNINTNSNTVFVLPPNACVLYTVTVKDIVDSDYCLTNQFKIKSCSSKKYIANDIVQNELLVSMKSTANNNTSNNSSNILYAKGRALALYKRSSEMLHYLLQQQQNEQEHEEDKQVENEQQNNEIKLLYADCLNNICVIYMICKEYKLAKEAAVTVLQYNPYNIKALIRAAKASLYDPSSDYNEVSITINAAQTEINILKEQQQQQSSLSSSSPSTINTTGSTTVVIQQLQNEIDKLHKDLYRKKQQYKEQTKQIRINIAKKFTTATTTTKDGENNNNNNKKHRQQLEKQKLDNILSNNRNKSNFDVTNIQNNNNVKQQLQQQLLPIQDKIIQWIQKKIYLLLSSSTIVLKIILFCFSIQIVITIIFFIYIQWMKYNHVSNDDDNNNNEL